MSLKLIESSRKPSPIMHPIGGRPPGALKATPPALDESSSGSSGNLITGIWGPDVEEGDGKKYWSPFSPSGLDTIHDNFLTPNKNLSLLDRLEYDTCQMDFEDSFSRVDSLWGYSTGLELSTKSETPKGAPKTAKVASKTSTKVPPGFNGKTRGRPVKMTTKPLYRTVASSKPKKRATTVSKSGGRFARPNTSRFSRPTGRSQNRFASTRKVDQDPKVMVCSEEASRMVMLFGLGLNTSDTEVRELLGDDRDYPVVVRKFGSLKRAHCFIEFPSLSKAKLFKARVENKALLGSTSVRAEIQIRGKGRGTTVCFGNLPHDVSKTEFLEELVSYHGTSHTSNGIVTLPRQAPEWDLLPIRIIRGKVTSKVLVDFPSEKDAKRAFRKFNGSSCFKSKYPGVKAEFEKKRQAVAITEVSVEQIYSLVKQKKSGIRMRDFELEFREYYKEHSVSIPAGQNLLKFLVKLDKLLLITENPPGDDVVIFFTEKTAFRSVLDIMHSHSSEGISVSTFKADLEKTLGSSLNHCNVIDFLRRWRVVSVEQKNGGHYDKTLRENQLIVKLAPMESWTVYLGHLDCKTTIADITAGLQKVNSEWSRLPVRLNHSKGMVNAFVDMPTFADAEACIRAFNKKRAFGSTCVRAEMENSTAQRAPSRTATPNTTPRSPIASSTSSPVSSSIRRKKFSWSKIAAKSPTVSGRPTLNIPLTKRDLSSSGVKRNYDKIYKLLENSKGGIRFPDLQRSYKSTFGIELKDLGSPKELMRNERLLLLNLKGAKSQNDVMVFMTEIPAYRLVADTIRSTHQLNTEAFTKRLKAKLNVDLSMCDTEDFLRRWRFVTIMGSGGGKKVHFTPNSGSTVFFGNLNKETTAHDIYEGLAKANGSWRATSVRLKTGKAGFNYAFVDFKTYEDAEKAVKVFDGKSAFKSKYVSADIEQAIEQKKGNTQYTIFIGNLPSTVTKSAIQKIVVEIDSNWADNPIRLNLRNGWSHAFVDFAQYCHATKAILHLNGAAKLGSTRLRVELSKNAL